jgi:PAS domain S-box-containing protein
MSVPQLAPLQQDLVQETLLGEALEHGPVAAIVLDEEGRYLAANRLACRLSGYTREELLAGGAAALVFDRARLKTAMELMASGDLHSGTAVLKRKDGTALACEYRVGETRSGGMPFFVVVFWEQSEAA